MTDNPWEVVATKPAPKPAQPQANDDQWSVASTKPALDLTSNPVDPKTGKGEGLYEMKGPDGVKSVPFSKVHIAQINGYDFAKDATKARYHDDVEATKPSRFETYTEPTQPTLNPNTTPKDTSWAANRDAAWNAAANALEIGKTGAGNVLKRAARTVAGTVQLPFHVIGIMGDLMSDDKATSEKAEDDLLALHPGAQIADRMKEAVHDWRKSPSLATENVMGDVLGMYLTGKAGDVVGAAVKNLPKAAEFVNEKYAPRSVELTGEKIPVLVGESNPETSAGRSQVALKRSGTGAKNFEGVEKEQYAKIKNVIRNIAQQTSGLVGPMQEEPGAAVSDAATATFEQAKPMYAALDEELVTVPGDLHAANVLVKKAIARAKNYGYDFDAASENHYGEEPLGMGGKVDAGNQPLTTFMKIRSELGKMRAASSDGAFRHNVTEEMKSMTDAMDKALDNTGLKDMWKEADRLWAKGYALREIADTLNSTTKGTPPTEQAGELSAVPTEMQGARLVDKLNELKRDGTLTRGFTPQEVSTLRKAADILDRIQTTPIGRGFGEGASQGRAIAHLLRGNAGPMIGAGVGFALNHTPVGAESGAALGFIAQRIGERALVNVMTKTEGIKLLRDLSKAKSPAQIGSAVNGIITLAGAESAVRNKSKDDYYALEEKPEQ